MKFSVMTLMLLILLSTYLPVATMAAADDQAVEAFKLTVFRVDNSAAPLVAADNQKDRMDKWFFWMRAFAMNSVIAPLNAN